MLAATSGEQGCQRGLAPSPKAASFPEQPGNDLRKLICPCCCFLSEHSNPHLRAHHPPLTFHLWASRWMETVVHTVCTSSLHASNCCSLYTAASCHRLGLHRGSGCSLGVSDAVRWDIKPCGADGSRTVRTSAAHPNKMMRIPERSAQNRCRVATPAGASSCCAVGTLANCYYHYVHIQAASSRFTEPENSDISDDI